jgi:hypothetical protein
MTEECFFNHCNMGLTWNDGNHSGKKYLKRRTKTKKAQQLREKLSQEASDAQKEDCTRMTRK